MVTQKDTVKIEINIAGEFIMLTVPYDKQDSVRECEKAINDLYSQWRRMFPRKTPSELIAMIAYQYASFFLELSGRYDALTAELHSISDDLDRLAQGEQPQASLPDSEGEPY